MALAALSGGCGGETLLPAPPSSACIPGCGETETCFEGVCLGSAAWSVALPVNVQGEVAVTAEGVVIASAATEHDRFYRPTVTAISPDGETLWERVVGSVGPFGFPSRPVLDQDGQIFVTVNFSLFALDADGYLSWTLDLPVMSDGGLAVNAANPPPPPALGSDGTVYWQFLAATGPKGDLHWRQYVDPYTPCETALPLRSDRVLFRGDHQLQAIDEEGEVAWAVRLPLDYFEEPGCGMIPYGDDLAATLWCAPGPSAFVCGHLIFFDVETGEIAWHTPPPKQVAMGTAMLTRPDGSIVIFSAGAPGNPDDPAHMWIVSPDGKSTGPSFSFPWHGIYHAALGDDGIFYVTTSAGLAAIDETGEVLWRYEPEFVEGSYSGAPAIGSNGCIYYESVKQRGGRFEYGREITCVRSTATGLAESPWPRSIGGNHSAMRSP